MYMFFDINLPSFASSAVKHGGNTFSASLASFFSNLCCLCFSFFGRLPFLGVSVLLVFCLTYNNEDWVQSHFKLNSFYGWLKKSTIHINYQANQHTSTLLSSTTKTDWVTSFPTLSRSVLVMTISLCLLVCDTVVCLDLWSSWMFTCFSTSKYLRFFFLFFGPSRKSWI